MMFNQAPARSQNPWGIDRASPLKTIVAGEIGEEIVEALREAFAKADACEFSFYATLTHEDIEARSVDLVMTLPFPSGGDAWEGLYSLSRSRMSSNYSSVAIPLLPVVGWTLDTLFPNPTILRHQSSAGSIMRPLQLFGSHSGSR